MLLVIFLSLNSLLILSIFFIFSVLSIFKFGVLIISGFLFEFELYMVSESWEFKNEKLSDKILKLLSDKECSKILLILLWSRGLSPEINFLAI